MIGLLFRQSNFLMLLFIRRNNLFPRLILNEANAYTTDTMHRVLCKEMELTKMRSLQVFIIHFHWHFQKL
jgi:hypothetical protein